MAKTIIARKRSKVIASTLAAILLAGAVWWGSVWAQPGGQAKVFFSSPVTVQAGDLVRVGFTNIGKKPVRVTVFLLDAEDSSLISQSAVFFKAPDGGAFEDITFSLGSGIIAAVRVAGQSQVRISLQVIDSEGRTRIFTDGFESGDVSA